MTSENQLLNILEYLTTSFRKHLWLWVVPTAIVGILGTNYAFLKSDKWSASQALHIRDEIKNQQNGRFDNNDERKIAQETIIGLARSRSVVTEALKKIGPPQNFILGNWPTSAHVRSTQDLVSVSVPKGSEVGGTEVVQLNVVSKSTARAIELNRAILDETIKKLKTLRSSKAKSVVSELSQKLVVSKKNLESATKRLEQMEQEIGSDLGELRTLDSLGTGESNLRTALTQVKNDLRVAQRKQTELKELNRFLVESKGDSSKLLAAPSSLLGSNTALQQLRDGLVAAQLKAADLTGQMSRNNPKLKAAINAEAEVRRQIKLEIPSAIEAVKAEREVNQALIAALDKELVQVQKRLSELAILRAPYSNLVRQVAAYAEQKRLAQEALDNALARQDSFDSSSLIAAIGEVEVADSPVGPGRKLIAAASWVGGFMVGAGLVFLASPITLLENRPTPHVETHFDGRRVADRNEHHAVQFGRRATDSLNHEVLESLQQGRELVATTTLTATESR